MMGLKAFKSKDSRWSSIREREFVCVMTGKVYRRRQKARSPA